ncbi:hypothetical protein ILUMI_16814 [Ignelater luminosus]|uniref:Reverse transcriptase Ty1/copia-type domain-containing protein n=1 Tax=Ignelater luminosus TaxID=2038154 RepID=A0A8K0CL15_IGNLU|nr:hypothetical protein ILUMI_16814 [Ignelater luminosus]
MQAAFRPGELLLADVYGPFAESSTKKKFLEKFKDSCSKFCHGYLMREKSKVKDKLGEVTRKSSVEGVSSYELWIGKKPKIKHLRVIGSLCCCYILAEGGKKINKKAINGYLIGYNYGERYRIWVKKENKGKNTWKLTTLPKGAKAIPWRWVYRVKTNPDGNVGTFKARMIIKGFGQRYEIDYTETFSPEAKLSTIR